MAICQSVLPQERIMEASHKSYTERLNDELNSLIAYKKQAETCKEKNELVSPIPRCDRYILPIPRVLESDIKEENEDKRAKKSRSPETRRRGSHPTESGLFQKRERTNVNNRRNLLESLKKVQGWIDSSNVKSPRQPDEPTKEEMTEKLATITLRDERDAQLENEMKDMCDRVAVVPPICSPDLQAMIPRDQRPLRATRGKMISVKASVISLEISGATDLHNAKSKSNLGLALTMKRVVDDPQDGHKAECHEGDGSGEMLDTVDTGGCGTLMNPDVETVRVSNWQEFQNFEAGDQLVRGNRNLGEWDCDRLEKVTKFTEELAPVNKNENIANRSVLNFEKSEKLKNIALKLSDYTKLKSMAVTVGNFKSKMQMSNENSQNELISIKSADIFPHFSRNNKVVGNELQRNYARDDHHGEPQENSTDISHVTPQKRRPYVGTRNYPPQFPIRASSYNHLPKQTKEVRSFGTSTDEPQPTEQPHCHHTTQHDAFVKDDDDPELIEILPPQFKAKDQPQGVKKVTICDYQAMENDPLPKFNTVTDSSGEGHSLALADRKRKIKRKKRKAHFKMPDISGDSDGWTDSETQMVSEMLKRLDMSPGGDNGQTGSGSFRLKDSDTLATEPSQSGQYVIDESKLIGMQGHGHKPEWLRNDTSQKLTDRGSSSVKQVDENFVDQSVHNTILDQMTEQEIKKHSNGSSSWDKRITPRLMVKDETSPSALDIQIPKGIHEPEDTPHFNSPSRDKIRDRNPVCVVSASATSVTNVVLLGKQLEEKSPLQLQSSHRQNLAKKFGFTSKTPDAAPRKEEVKHSLYSQNRFVKRKLNNVEQSTAREISTSTNDFNKQMSTFNDLDSDSEDSKQTRTLSQANLFMRPKFTLDPLLKIRNKSKNITPYSITNSACSKSSLDELKRLPIRRRVSNDELTKTKNEISSLLSKTSAILLRNDTEGEMKRRGNSPSLYHKMTKDLRKNSLPQGNANTGCGLNVNNEDVSLLTDRYAGDQGFESDESLRNCPINSLGSLLSRQPHPDEDLDGKNSKKCGDKHELA